MRRKNRIKNKLNSNITVLIAGGILLISIIAFVITFIIYSNKLDMDLKSYDSEYLAQYGNQIEINTDDDKQITSASSSIGKSIEETKNEKNNITNKVNKTNESHETKKPIIKNQEKKDPIFVLPIKGEIIKEYAKDSLIYSDTLKEWTTHLGIDIKAKRATVVKAASDGIVKYIKNDPRYGLTIIIEHSNGFETRYCNLLTTEFVSEGEHVKMGQTIGTVGDSAIYEIVDETHLHFELLKNNESVNPSKYIKY